MPEQAPVTLVACVKTRQPGSPSCGGRGSEALIQALKSHLVSHGQPVDVAEVQCLGRCAQGPNLRIKGGPFFSGVTAQRFEAIRAAVAAHRAGEVAPVDPGAVPPAARG